MQENRMFSDVKLAKRLTPAWLSPFFAFFREILPRVQFLAGLRGILHSKGRLVCGRLCQYYKL